MIRKKYITSNSHILEVFSVDPNLEFHLFWSVFNVIKYWKHFSRSHLHKKIWKLKKKHKIWWCQRAIFWEHILWNPQSWNGLDYGSRSGRFPNVRKVLEIHSREYWWHQKNIFGVQSIDSHKRIFLGSNQ